ncbi:DNA-binding response regulator [Streptomyces sp. FXJ1.172]|uniref:helix-turn-helix transcriptional regulator n=1 Tax=Streptomyces sp. FXJ1.172 TaxID=710705 RepID=UPI0007CF0A86|nr:DNA-binding response regulator [Streptomyces sp. FXJ1.172]WEO95157.1 DNA-binding response regulator [Streptomyces sp. FXJ1.172]
MEFRSLPAPRFVELSADQPQENRGDAMTELVARARRTVLISLSGRHEQLAAVRSVLGDLRARAKAGPGRLTVRVLGPAAALRELPAWADDLADLRVTGQPLAESLMADGAEALTRAPGDASGDLLVRDRSAVRVLTSLFMGAWEASLPWPECLRLNAYLTSDTARGVLDRLRAGATDAVAARQLGLSLRTYRRHVARILECLGVSSRFSGGTRAAELQLFDMP